MTKLLFLIVLLTTISPAFAQFKLTPKGFISEENSDKNYVILEYKDKTKDELFELAKSYLTSIYPIPEVVVKIERGDIVVVNGTNKRVITINKNDYKSHNIDYILTFEFKDGKIKINCPEITSIYQGSLVRRWNEFWIFGYKSFKNGVYNKKNNKLMNETAKESIEDFFNTYIIKFRDNIDDSHVIEEDW